MRVCLDAGHYGKYNQSKVFPSYYESEMTWKLHLLLKAQLEKYGVEVITTREKQNVDLALDLRGKKSKGCDLFISIHSDATSSEKPDWSTVIPYQDVNWTDIDDKSRDIANKLGACVRDTMGLSKYRLYPRKSGNDRDGNGKLDDEYYGVLYGARKVGTAGVLVEHGFHTNLKCAEWLSNDANLKELAKAEAKVIYDWLRNNATHKAPVVTKPQTKPQNSSGIDVGSVVKIAPDATFYTGKPVATWVRGKNWIVSSISGDRVVIDKSEDGKNAIRSPINIKYLTVAKPVSTETEFQPYMVRVKANTLNIRKGAGTNYAVVGKIKDKGAYTIIAESEGKGASKWGRLKSKVGWISLDYTEKVERPVENDMEV